MARRDKLSMDKSPLLTSQAVILRVTLPEGERDFTPVSLVCK